jgi:hypothetical protein
MQPTSLAGQRGFLPMPAQRSRALRPRQRGTGRATVSRRSFVRLLIHFSLRSWQTVSELNHEGG